MEEKENRLANNLSKANELAKEFNYEVFNVSATCYSAVLMFEYCANRVKKAQAMGFAEVSVSDNGFLNMKKENVELVFT